MSSWSAKADAFLREAHLYRLGVLPTEHSHPKTKRLSEWALHEPHRAVDVLRDLDLATLAVVERKLPALENLARDVRETLEAGHRIFLAGCGATGRLSLSLENFWRSIHPGSDQVISFMAGGDVALVRAVEGFEDHADFGERQLIELGFRDGDLLVACTEGGETPFVIGATEAGARLSRRKPWFLYCNPREILTANVERSRRVLESPAIHSLELFVGPMALAGSTRLQATTVLQLAVGLALLEETAQWPARIHSLARSLRAADVDSQVLFAERESRVYGSGGYMFYVAHDLAITVFTDTTERAPTFSLPSFGNRSEQRDQHSLAHVILPEADTPEAAWRLLLGRSPRPLNWSGHAATTTDYLLGFDFSRSGRDAREKLLPGPRHVHFEVRLSERQLLWRIDELEARFPRPESLLLEHLYLKLLLNSHSTLVMGRIGRYRSNMMTWVYPSNGKLVDRASRYVRELLLQEGIDVEIPVVIRALFQEMESLKPNESVVLKTCERLRANSV